MTEGALPRLLIRQSFHMPPTALQGDAFGRSSRLDCTQGSTEFGCDNPRRDPIPGVSLQGINFLFGPRPADYSPAHPGIL
jgi:hypothetical protein